MPTTKPITVCYNNQTRTLAEWADCLNLHYPTLYARYTRGLPPSRILASSPKTIATKLITHNGQTMQLRHWAKALGLPYPTLRMRYTRGLRGAELLRPKTVQIADRLPTPTTIKLEHKGMIKTLFEWSRIYGVGFDTVYARYSAGERDPDRLFRQPHHP